MCRWCVFPDLRYTEYGTQMQTKRLRPRAPLTTDRRTGGMHKTRKKQIHRKRKHKGKEE